MVSANREPPRAAHRAEAGAGGRAGEEEGEGRSREGKALHALQQTLSPATPRYAPPHLSRPAPLVSGGELTIVYSRP